LNSRRSEPNGREREVIYRWKATLKAILRDWCFADYKWIARAQVQREICAARWEYRDHPLVQRVLSQLQETTG